MSNYAKFIDIYDGDNIKDFDALKNSDLEGVITKATEGTTAQSKYHRYRYDQCKSRGIPIGFYHMLCVTSEPETQAENFYREVGDLNNDIRNALDIEYDNLGSRAEEYANRFLARYYELSGQDMIIYSCQSYFYEHFSNEFLNSHDLWVAKYSSSMPNLPNQVAWQYTDRHSEYWFVSDSAGDLDMNYLLDPSKFYTKDYTPSINTSQEKNNENIENIYSQLQQMLNDQGFRDKNGNELVVDGVAGELTLSACPVVKQGARGEITKWIQLRLGMTGSDADGIFGQFTKDCVIGFQSSSGLTADGIVGQNTWRKLLHI